MKTAQPAKEQSQPIKVTKVTIVREPITGEYTSKPPRGSKSKEKPGLDYSELTRLAANERQQTPPPPDRDSSLIETQRQQALAALSSQQKLELFLNLCQQGVPTVSALKASGMMVTYGYDPSSPTAEVEVEELFFMRAQTKLTRKLGERFKDGIIPDDEFYAPVESKNYDPRPGDLSRRQLYALVDWLYFIKAIPLTTIASMLQVNLGYIGTVKATLSTEVAKSIRAQSSEGYIADLMRTKDHLRADLTSRRTRLGPTQSFQAVQINKLLWELENRFVDRLQEIGLIDKTLGRIDVSEEWHVTIDAVGQPQNQKLIPSTAISQDASFLEADVNLGPAPGTEEHFKTQFATASVPDFDVTEQPTGHLPTVEQAGGGAINETGETSSDDWLKEKEDWVIKKAEAVRLKRKRSLSAVINIGEMAEAANNMDCKG